MSEGWRVLAACAPDNRPPGMPIDRWVAQFFPERGQSPAAARQICESCPVSAECDAYAMGPPKEPNGIWGGVSERQRRARRRGSRTASPQKLLRDARAAEARRMYDTGWEVPAIARELRVTRSRIWRYLGESEEAA